MKKIKNIILVFTVAFLLFEILFFSSNNQSIKLNDSNLRDVYELAILDSDREQFMNEYASIILDEDNDKLIVMTTKDIIQKIGNDYNIIVD